MIADASDAKKYSTCLSSNGSNSEVDPVRGRVGYSSFPCGRYSINKLLFKTRLTSILNYSTSLYKSCAW